MASRTYLIYPHTSQEKLAREPAVAQPKQTDPQFKLRLTPELKAGIETAAASNNRSMNAEIVARLEASLLKDDPSGLADAASLVADLRDRLSARLTEMTTSFDKFQKQSREVEDEVKRRLREERARDSEFLRKEEMQLRKRQKEFDELFKAQQESEERTRTHYERLANNALTREREFLALIQSLKEKGL